VNQRDPLTDKTGLTKAERKLRGSAGGHARWKNAPDRQAATKKMRDAANYTRFESQVDPDRKLPPEVRSKLAANARREHMQKLALKASRRRRERQRESRGGAA
jgi:hypothetical protein